ncbi:MAG: hypothetical protein K5669_01995 [Lachnospiraceae bacterium]|nr:hypothetical protein [Lachnospiraceae bacterium]
MVDADERVEKLLKDSIRNKEKEQIKRSIIGEIVGSVICIALFVVVCVYLPGIGGENKDVINFRFGSLILQSSFMGYIVLGVLGVILGTLLTFMGIKIHKMKKMDGDN